tara:strand:- start:7925 stop:9364 length:1440 start_codon:yes stop_codon:yes gene_type:complete
MNHIYQYLIFLFLGIIFTAEYTNSVSSEFVRNYRLSSDDSFDEPEICQGSASQMTSDQYTNCDSDDKDFIGFFKDLIDSELSRQSFGYQYWIDGRLKTFYTNAVYNSTFPNVTEPNIPRLLENLKLSGNNFSGPVPDWFENLDALETLIITANNEITDFEVLSSMPSLNNIYLTNHFISDNLVDNLSQIDNLSLIIEDTYSIADSSINFLGEIESLINLTIESNDLIDLEIPPEIGSLTNLANLTIQSNDNLIGEVPPDIGNLTNLVNLTISSNNQLAGEIPEEIGNLTNLTSLNLKYNELTGDIPNEIGNLTNLTQLRLYNNQLTGEIPSSVWNLTNLNTLHLSGNELTGEIPSEIRNLTNLTQLWLHNNQLNGEIPLEICDQGDSTPSIDYNNFCPPYPDCGEGPITTEEQQSTFECADCSVVTSDLNNDLSLNIMDVIIMVGCVLSETCDSCSDFNQDGSADILDIVELVNVILGE